MIRLKVYLQSQVLNRRRI